MTAEKGPGFEPKKILVARCWSCGKPLPEGGKCTDPECSGAPALKVTPPKTVLPFCGQDHSLELISNGAGGYKIKDLPDPKIVEMRPCCKCGKSWMCDYHTWINGSCPHCGASGSDGKGGKGYSKFQEKIKLEPQSFTEVLPDSVYLKDYSDLKNVLDRKRLDLTKKEKFLSELPKNQKLIDFLNGLDSNPTS